jgi:hypothetical protein
LRKIIIQIKDRDGRSVVKKKVGIITEYCHSINYGGNLQAYALVSVVRSLGYSCEQIQYISNFTSDKLQNSGKSVFSKKTLKNIIRSCKRKAYRLINSTFLRKRLQSQKNSFTAFNLNIPHSVFIYNDDTIRNCVDDYYTIITGSDQVWNLDYQKFAYFLDFVPSHVRKLSYAASLGTGRLTDTQKEFFSKKIEGYDGISVREEDSVPLLQALTATKVHWHLDPTLLLSKNDWNLVCDERVVEEKYIFCYFLGADTALRDLAQRYAKEKHLKIVTIPYLLGTYRKCDVFFGDIRRNDITPEKFISLIKHAECILTDSFHACVFSLIYQKQFFAFHRFQKKERASRIYSLMNLFDVAHRFCDSAERMNIEYMNVANPISYDQPFALFEEKKNESLSYLKNHLAQTRSEEYQNQSD